MSEDCNFATSRCILCSRKYKATAVFRNINSTYLRDSKKSIKDVLNHLAKSINIELQDEEIAYVCGSCYTKLSLYDEVMVVLLVHQKYLLKLLKRSINTCKLNDNDQIINEGKTVSISSIDSCSNDHEIALDDCENTMHSNDIDNSGNEADSDVDDDSTSQDNKSRHYTKSSLSSLQCSICNKNLSSKTSLRTHLKTHSTRCPICGVYRKNEEYLELHMNVHEGKSETQCRYCPKVYTQRAHAVRHMQMHWNKLKFQCEKCGIRFSQGYMLYNHRMHHEAQEKPLICGICDQVFKSRKTYRQHKLTHQDDRPMYPCEVCGKQFTLKYTLKVHLRRHFEAYDDDGNSLKLNSTEKIKLNQQKFSCIICESVFSATDTLATHMAEEHDVINN